MKKIWLYWQYYKKLTLDEFMEMIDGIELELEMHD
ncbi:hypothetical protein ABIC55_003388 [Sporosarcina psychrophila]|uniref:Uncharacterized protein n=1 Tax=Sporosarcina psychrophila TaxID=1476 RepID=A0ABV2KB13_SPOPS